MQDSHQQPVPEITIKLKEIIKQTQASPLFNNPQTNNQPVLTQKFCVTHRKRIPGQITNLRRSTVNHTLNIFKPFHEGNQQEFYDKKQIVLNAIEAIYMPVSGERARTKQRDIQRNNQNTGRIVYQHETFGKNSLVRSRSKKKYYTPERKSNIYRQQSSTQAPLKTLSMSKLDFQRGQSKFSRQQIMKLRKRMGCLK